MAKTRGIRHHVTGDDCWATGKRRFRDDAAALAAVDPRQPGPWYCYACQYCGSVHLTHIDPARYGRRPEPFVSARYRSAPTATLAEAARIDPEVAYWLGRMGGAE